MDKYSTLNAIILIINLFTTWNISYQANLFLCNSWAPVGLTNHPLVVTLYSDLVPIKSFSKNALAWKFKSFFIIYLLSSFLLMSVTKLREVLLPWIC